MSLRACKTVSFRISPLSKTLQPEGIGFAATLSTSQEQKLSEQLQQIRLLLSDLREAVQKNAKALTPEVAAAMQSTITTANGIAADAKEMAEVLKVLLKLCASHKWSNVSSNSQLT